jgi:DNA primase catalytic core
MKEFEEVVKACSFLLCDFHGAEPVRNYLNNRLTPEAQEKFEFGYFPNEENISLLTGLVSESTLLKCKLLYEKIVNDFSEDPWDYIDDSDLENSGACHSESKVFKNNKVAKQLGRIVKPVLKDHNLIMPYKDAYGNVIALVGRTVAENYQDLGIPKYKNTSFEKGHHLFGLSEAKREMMKQDFVYVVEGQFDCIKAHERGLTNTVALGSSSMTLYQLSIICRYTKNIQLLLDNDEAGEKGRFQILKKYKHYADFLNLYIPPQYKDLDEYLSSLEIGQNPFFITRIPNS